jgi:hypothetical protein
MLHLLNSLQFDISGVNLTDATSGLGDVSFGSSGTVIGFSMANASLPAGSGNLVTLTFEETAAGGGISASDVIVSGGGGNSSCTDCAEEPFGTPAQSVQDELPPPHETITSLALIPPPAAVSSKVRVTKFPLPAGRDALAILKPITVPEEPKLTSPKPDVASVKFTPV